MPFRAGFALREKFLLQLENQVRVLAMRGRDHSELLGELKRFVKFFIGNSKSAFVGEKDFEAANAPFDDFDQLPLGLRIVAGDAQVEGEVTSALVLRFTQPQLEGGHRFVSARRANHLDHRSRPAHQRSFARTLMRVLGERAHEGQINKDVGIDEAWKDVFAGRIDHFCAGRRREVALDAGDGFVLAENVGDKTFAGRDDFAVLDEQRHRCYLKVKEEILQQKKTQNGACVQAISRYFSPLPSWMKSGGNH